MNEAHYQLDSEALDLLNLFRFVVRRRYVKKIKVKQSRCRPTEFQEVKVPRFHDIGTGWCQACQPHAPAAFTPRKYTWYSFLLEAESTLGPQCDRKDYVTEIFQ